MRTLEDSIKYYEQEVIRMKERIKAFEDHIAKLNKRLKQQSNESKRDNIMGC